MLFNKSILEEKLSIILRNWADFTILCFDNRYRHTLFVIIREDIVEYGCRPPIINTYSKQRESVFFNSLLSTS